MIISSAAFGKRFPWPTDTTPDFVPPGRKIGYVTALQGAIDKTIFRLILPKVSYQSDFNYASSDCLRHTQWTYKLPILKTPKLVELYFTEFEGHLHDMIAARRTEKAGGVEHSDLFSALLKGVSDEEGEGVLTDEQLCKFSRMAS